MIATGAIDGSVQVWDADNGQEIKSFPRHGGRVSTVEFFRDGKTLVSGGADRTIRFWDIDEGKESGHGDTGEGVTGRAGRTSYPATRMGWGTFPRSTPCRARPPPGTI